MDNTLPILPSFTNDAACSLLTTKWSTLWSGTLSHCAPYIIGTHFPNPSEVEGKNEYDPQEIRFLESIELSSELSKILAPFLRQVSPVKSTGLDKNSGNNEEKIEGIQSFVSKCMEESLFAHISKTKKHKNMAKVTEFAKTLDFKGFQFCFYQSSILADFYSQDGNASGSKETDLLRKRLMFGIEFQSILRLLEQGRKGDAAAQFLVVLRDFPKIFLPSYLSMVPVSQLIDWCDELVLLLRAFNKEDNMQHASLCSNALQHLADYIMETQRVHMKNRYEVEADRTAVPVHLNSEDNSLSIRCSFYRAEALRQVGKVYNALEAVDWVLEKIESFGWLDSILTGIYVSKLQASLGLYEDAIILLKFSAFQVQSVNPKSAFTVLQFVNIAILLGALNRNREASDYIAEANRIFQALAKDACGDLKPNWLLKHRQKRKKMKESKTANRWGDQVTNQPYTTGCQNSNSIEQTNSLSASTPLRLLENLIWYGNSHLCQSRPDLALAELECIDKSIRSPKDPLWPIAQCARSLAASVAAGNGDWESVANILHVEQRCAEKSLQGNTKHGNSVFYPRTGASTNQHLREIALKHSEIVLLQGDMKGAQLLLEQGNRLKRKCSLENALLGALLLKSGHLMEARDEFAEATATEFLSSGPEAIGYGVLLFYRCMIDLWMIEQTSMAHSNTQLQLEELPPRRTLMHDLKRAQVILERNLGSNM